MALGSEPADSWFERSRKAAAHSRRTGVGVMTVTTPRPDGDFDASLCALAWWGTDIINYKCYRVIGCDGNSNFLSLIIMGNNRCYSCTIIDLVFSNPVYEQSPEQV